MSLLQRGLKSVPLLRKSLNIQPVRNVQGIPCRNPIPTGQMVMMGGALAVSWLTVPIYILLNLKYYNGTATRE